MAIVYEGPEFRHLIAFVAVAEECSFGKAAERIGISQPALSHQIKQLEDGLLVNLVIRSQAGATLTVYGRQFLLFARKILHMRDHAVRATSLDKSGAEWPLRFGYSPFADHKLVDAVRIGYRDLVPGGEIEASSDCSAELTQMVADGRLDAAIVTLPLTERDLFSHPICREKLLVCLRRDDPLAHGERLPKRVLADRLSILFARSHQPELYDGLMRKFSNHGIEIKPFEFYSAPAEMQYMVKSGKGWSLVQESTRLDLDLILMPIADLSLTLTTALICQSAQMRPVLPLLAYQIAKQCEVKLMPRKRPNGRVTAADLRHVKQAG
jgi:DNA-binding transcriptional LysR family regulator